MINKQLFTQVNFQNFNATGLEVCFPFNGGSGVKDIISGLDALTLSPIESEYIAATGIGLTPNKWWKYDNDYGIYRHFGSGEPNLISEYNNDSMLLLYSHFSLGCKVRVDFTDYTTNEGIIWGGSQSPSPLLTQNLVVGSGGFKCTFDGGSNYLGMAAYNYDPTGAFIPASGDDIFRERWYDVYVNYNGATGVAELIVNGTLQSSGVVTPTNYGAYNFMVGNVEDGSKQFIGGIAEMKLYMVPTPVGMAARETLGNERYSLYQMEDFVPYIQWSENDANLYIGGNAPASGDMNLYVGGLDVSTGDVTLMTPGGSGVTLSCNLHTISGNEFGSVNLYTHNVTTVNADTLNLFVNSYLDYVNKDANLYIKGASASLGGLVRPGYLPSSGDMNLFLLNLDQYVNESCTLFIGSNTIQDDVTMYINASITSDGECTLYASGIARLDTDFNLFTSGY